MSKKQYIALQSIQVCDETGARRSIEPRAGKSSGLFEHTFDAKDAKRLIAMGAIREPEGTETHEDPTRIETLYDSRVIDAVAVQPALEAPSEPEPDPKPASKASKAPKGDDIIE